jgi:DNA-binding XRE family transcriptional regulator
VTPTPAEALSAAKRLKRPPRKPGTRTYGPWVGNSIRERRDALGLSLRDVADAIGISNPGLFAVEKGGDPQLTTAYKLAAFFGCSVEAIWPPPAPKRGRKQ